MQVNGAERGTRGGTGAARRGRHARATTGADMAEDVSSVQEVSASGAVQQVWGCATSATRAVQQVRLCRSLSEQGAEDILSPRAAAMKRKGSGPGRAGPGRQAAAERAISTGRRACYGLWRARDVTRDKCPIVLLGKEMVQFS